MDGRGIFNHITDEHGWITAKEWECLALGGDMHRKLEVFFAPAIFRAF